MVLTRLQEKKTNSDMTTGGSYPDAKWALEFEAKHKTRMDKLEKTMASLNNDPIRWISRAEKYFRFHSTSNNAKVELASINLEGDAIQWYDWLEAVMGLQNGSNSKKNSSIDLVPPVMRILTKEEIKERMTKGLCWHCDEKWYCGHQCKQKRILMIEPIENSEEEDDFDEGETQDNINEVQYDSMAISVHALEGLQTPQTMKHSLFVKRAKCSFGTTKLEYLGYIVSQKGAATDPSKVLVMMEWPIPKSIKALRDFLGLIDAFRWSLEAKKIHALSEVFHCRSVDRLEQQMSSQLECRDLPMVACL
ncbi:hypothetical protein ZIOFF_066424 [Zingiber officinale]|uniref:Retrotransposon gag domain-containing protein n=1 Tax=Zingiber officinale TaxID=94328 RepID=A0A8J5EYG2_ZINOF|nr:hypothetical protein ZIOFF_066424 [Zingiber officinale]